MDKKLLSTVIVAALAAPMAAMADTTLYGQIHMNVGAIDDGVTDEMAVRNHASRLGVKGSEDLGNGLKANFQLEWEVSPDEDGAGSLGSGQNGGGDGGFARRNQWVGLSSDSWGEVRIGRHDIPTKMAQGKFDQFNDTDGDIGGIVNGEHRADNVIAYISNDFNGLSFAAAAIAGEGTNTNDGLADAYDLAAMYSNGPIFASLSYLSYGEGIVGFGGANVEPSLVRLVGTYNVTEDLMVGGMYATYDADATTGDEDTWGLSAKFSMGSNAIKAQYMTSETDTAGADFEEDEWSIGFDHSFSKRTTGYVMYNDYETENANSEYDSFTVGVVHKF